MVDGPKDDAFDLDSASAKEFSKARRGWDPSEVKAHTLSLVEEIRRLRRSESDLAKNVARLETDLAQKENPDASAMTRLLGEETTRVLDAAREAADEIRSRSEENASRLVREAHEQAAALTEEAHRLHETAARDSDELLATARATSDEMLSDARERSQAIRAEAEEKAAEVLQHADGLMSEKTAAANAAAEHIRAEADEIRNQARDQADALGSAAEKDAADLRERAAADAEEQSRRAEEESERILEEAITAASEARRTAEEDSLARIETAREQGRAMVTEAREARERMLRDLAERRKLARQQLEALRAGREHLLESFAAARTAFDAISTEVVDAVPNARSAADAAARSVDDDIDAAVAELDLEIGGRIDLDDDLDVDPSMSDAVESVDDVMPSSTEARDPRGDDASDSERADPDAAADLDLVPDEGADDGDEGGDAPDGGSAHLRLVSAGVAGTDLLDDDDDFDEDFDEDDDLDGGDVEELFARLRAERESRSISGDEVLEDDSDADPDAPYTGRDAVIIDLLAAEEDAGPSSSGGGGDAAAAESAVAVRTSESQDMLDRRDLTLDPVARDVNRRLKRWVSDLENGLLDRVRRQRKDRSSASLLDDATVLAESCADSLAPDLTRAVEAGADFAGEVAGVATTLDSSAGVEMLSSAISEQLIGPLLSRLVKVIDSTDDTTADGAEMVGRIRSVFREWRGDKLSEVADDLAHHGFNRGVLAGSPPDSTLCWLVDFGGLPCPDGEDNHLAGAVARGDSFPTGDVCPPAHAGCRCLLIPQSSDS